MNSNTWLRAVVVVVPAITLAVGVAHSRQRHQPAIPAAGLTGTQNALELTGILGPNVTIPVDAPGMVLTVPLNSYVAKDQVIGQAASDDSPALGLTPEEADAAVARAGDDLRNAEIDLEAARQQQGDTQLEEASARANERYTESSLGNLDQEFRERDLSVARYYRYKDRLRSAEDIVNRTQSKVVEATSEVDTASAKVEEARNALNQAETERRRVDEAAEQGGSAQLVDVVAPADGYVVLRDPASNAYGIGTNDASLRVVAQVPSEDLSRLRPGQEATVSFDKLPSVRLQATVLTIDDIPAQTAAGDLFTVTFAVPNPRGLSFDDEPVHILVGGNSK